jgi:hypothetical protein
LQTPRADWKGWGRKGREIKIPSLNLCLQERKKKNGRGAVSAARPANAVKELCPAMLPSQRLKAVALAFWWTLMTSLPAPALSAKRMHNIYWNTTNPMFRIDNTDNVIDVNTGNLPWEYDQVTDVLNSKNGVFDSKDCFIMQKLDYNIVF